MSGINKTLREYKEQNSLLQPMLTAKEVMENLHIKDYRTLKKIIAEKNMPYIEINGQYLIPRYSYDKWVASMTKNFKGG